MLLCKQQEILLRHGNRRRQDSEAGAVFILATRQKVNRHWSFQGPRPGRREARARRPRPRLRVSAVRRGGLGLLRVPAPGWALARPPSLSLPNSDVDGFLVDLSRGRGMPAMTC